MVSGIYQITCLVNGKRYIGSSVDVFRRWADHRRALRNGKHPNPKLQAVCSKYGLSNLGFEFVESVEPSKLMAAEQAWLDTERPELNINPNADAPCRGAPPEIVAKISKSLTGKKASAETRAKMSATRRGRPMASEQRQKIREAMAGRASRPPGFKHSEATMAKMKAAWISRRSRAI